MHEHFCTASATWLAMGMCRSLGVELIPLGHQADGLVVAGLGTGIVLAFADHLLRCYPGLDVMVADLPGRMGLERRCAAIDYICQAFPTVLLMWHSLGGGERYPRYLREVRGFRPRFRTWVYVRGLLGMDDANARRAWADLGCTILDDLWGKHPLGELSPDAIARPWDALALNQEDE